MGKQPYKFLTPYLTGFDVTLWTHYYVPCILDGIDSMKDTRKTYTVIIDASEFKSIKSTIIGELYVKMWYVNHLKRIKQLTIYSKYTLKDWLVFNFNNISAINHKKMTHMWSMKFIDQYWTLTNKRMPAIHFNFSTIYVQTTQTEHQVVKHS